MNADVDRFLDGYVRCALWSSTDNADDSGGAPLDDNYGPQDIAPEAMATMRADCEWFLRDNAEDVRLYLVHVVCVSRSRLIEYAGHDFWLTRNGHGSGFWDRDGVGEDGRPEGPEGLGKRLSDASEKFGACDLYIGDDGGIYVYSPAGAVRAGTPA